MDLWVIVLLAVLILLSVSQLVLAVLLRSRREADDGGRTAQRLSQMEYLLASLEKAQEKLDQSLREEMARNRDEASSSARQAREEIANSLRGFGDSTSSRITESFSLQQTQLVAMRVTIEEKLRQIQEDNTKKLEEMRATVDEKLHSTLEQRLSESFKMVSERLEQVYKGLGEMQNLAVGVGDLKKVLTNVKTRGVFGEFQLGNILEEILAPDQYCKNVATREDSREVVEYAVKLPGPDDGGPVLLPIDAKFSQEDYLRLLEAYEIGEPAAIEQAAKGLESRIRLQAKDICNKYICVPATTDFAIMFLPTESLYAEVLRRPGLVEGIQREFRVNVTGPATLAAFLNSLAVGFRTLAIQKHSQEVWTVLGAVKTEFNKYADVLTRVHKQLQTVSNSVEDAQRKTRAIERKLRTVEGLPVKEATAVLDDPDEVSDPDTTA